MIKELSDDAEQLLCVGSAPGCSLVPLFVLKKMELFYILDGGDCDVMTEMQFVYR